MKTTSQFTVTGPRLVMYIQVSMGVTRMSSSEVHYCPNQQNECALSSKAKIEKCCQFVRSKPALNWRAVVGGFTVRLPKSVHLWSGIGAKAILFTKFCSIMHFYSWVKSDKPLYDGCKKVTTIDIYFSGYYRILWLCYVQGMLLHASFAFYLYNWQSIGALQCNNSLHIESTESAESDHVCVRRHLIKSRQSRRVCSVWLQTDVHVQCAWSLALFGLLFLRCHWSHSRHNLDSIFVVMLSLQISGRPSAVFSHLKGCRPQVKSSASYAL